MAEEVTNHSKQFPWIGFWLAIIFLMMVGTLVASGYIGYQWVLTKQQNRQALESLNTSLLQVKDIATTSATTAQTIATEFKTIQLSVADLTKAQLANKEQWALTEAYYLVRLADDNLRLSHHVANAIFLLDLANKEIADLHDPQYDSIRAALTDDLANLKKIPLIDTSGLYLRIATINKNITQLPLFNKRGQVVIANDHHNQALPWWQRAWDSIIVALQKVVTVRYNEAGKLPLVTPDVQMYLYQNCQSQLNNAQWALLHGQAVIYHTSLLQTIDWIKDYFVVDANVTQVILKELDDLNKLDVSPTLPDLSSLAAFAAVNQIAH